jgi:hypothetical protein
MLDNMVLSSSVPEHTNDNIQEEYKVHYRLSELYDIGRGCRVCRGFHGSKTHNLQVSSAQQPYLACTFLSVSPLQQASSARRSFSIPYPQRAFVHLRAAHSSIGVLRSTQHVLCQTWS